MAEAKNIPYIGNGAYCYANSMSMLLTSIGEEITPFIIEVLSGVGLGAFILKGTNLLFFGWEVPDNGIDNALKILRFNCIAGKISKTKPAPISQLKENLKKSPVVIGPLDMGYLVYNPRYLSLRRADHFVLVYGIDKDGVHLHDPAGFPHVILSIDNLKIAWKAKGVGYSEEFYRYWAVPKRIKSPTTNEIHKSAVELFKALYEHSRKKATREDWIVGKDAILKCADRIRGGKVKKEEIEHLTHFALPLGAKRALDYVSFFNAFDSKLADLKKRQAVLFGKVHTFAVDEGWGKMIIGLEELSEIEEEFRISLLSK